MYKIIANIWHKVLLILIKNHEFLLHKLRRLDEKHWWIWMENLLGIYDT
jgi:hypothetical protein